MGGRELPVSIGSGQSGSRSMLNPNTSSSRGEEEGSLHN